MTKLAWIQQYLPVAAMAGGNTDFETKPALGSWLLQQSSRIEQDQLEIKAEPETMSANNCQGVSSVTYQTKSFQAASQEAEEKSVFRCPDCPKVFKHVSGVYIHASQTHYASHLQVWSLMQFRSVISCTRTTLSHWNKFSEKLVPEMTQKSIVKMSQQIPSMDQYFLPKTSKKNKQKEF